MITEPISMFLRSALYKRTALADLKKIQRLTPALQNEIAANVAAFINLASVSSDEAFLYDFLATATQQRHAATAAGATSIADARLAAASLSESWCGAKLAAGKRQISVPLLKSRKQLSNSVQGHQHHNNNPLGRLACGLHPKARRALGLPCPQCGMRARAIKLLGARTTILLKTKGPALASPFSPR